MKGSKKNRLKCLVKQKHSKNLCEKCHYIRIQNWMGTKANNRFSKLDCKNEKCMRNTACIYFIFLSLRQPKIIWKISKRCTGWYPIRYICLFFISFFYTSNFRKFAKNTPFDVIESIWKKKNEKTFFRVEVFLLYRFVVDREMNIKKLKMN